MNSTQHVPWKRISVEAAAIVASILLAFSIDAWWDRYQNSQDNAYFPQLNNALAGQPKLGDRYPTNQ